MARLFRAVEVSEKRNTSIEKSNYCQYTVYHFGGNCLAVIIIKYTGVLSSVPTMRTQISLDLTVKSQTCEVFGILNRLLVRANRRERLTDAKLYGN